MNKTQQITKLEQARNLLKEVALDFSGYGEADGFNRLADDIQESIDIFKECDLKITYQV